jgi:hypothetical protein
MNKPLFFVSLLLSFSSLCLPSMAGINYSGHLKQAQKNYPALKKTICSQSVFGQKGNFCDLRSVRVIGNWAWVTWTSGESGGSSVLKYSGSNWKHIYGGGGVIGIQDSIEHGVPKAIAEVLIPNIIAFSDFSETRISSDEIENFSEWELMIARNSIFARHGRVFKYKPLHDYFMTWPWYRPDPNYNDNMLSDIEKHNANVILEMEKNKGYM